MAVTEAEFIYVQGEHSQETGVPCSNSVFQLTVEALEDRAVIVNALRPVILSRQPPSGRLQPTLGALVPRRFVVALDADPPRLETRDEADPDFPFQVKLDEPEIFQLQMQTERWDVAWLLELDWICAGHTGTMTIDLAGHPFRTIARPSGQSLQW